MTSDQSTSTPSDEAVIVDSEHPEHSAHHHAGNFSDRERKIAAIVVSLAFVMDLLDMTIVNVAIPSIQENIGASYAAIQWVIAGYALAFATILITGGRLGDVVGYKKLFLVGIVAFTASSLVCGIASSPGILIFGRVLQGIGAALMVPQVMSLIQVMYPPAERSKIMGIFGALGGLAASLGPVIGGFLIHWDIAGLSWRPIFLINIPVGLLALYTGYRYLPEGRSPHPLKLDLVGTVLVVFALGLFIYPLIQGREHGWPWWGFVMLAASAPLFVVFWRWQKKKDALDGSPLVVPALFKVKTYARGLSMNVIFQFVLIGAGLATTLTLQVGFGYSVIKAALTGLPAAIGIGLSIAVLAPKLTPILGRYVVTLGAVIMSIGIGITALVVNHLGADTQPWHLLPGILLNGVGTGLIMGLIFAVTLADVDTAHAGSASGTLNAFDQAGAAVGIALVGILFFGALSANASASFNTAEPKIRESLITAHVPSQFHDVMINGIRRCYTDRAKESDASVLPQSCKDLEIQSASAQGSADTNVSSAWFQETTTRSLQIANGRNFAHAYVLVSVYSIGIALVCLLLGLLLPRRIEFKTEH